MEVSISPSLLIFTNRFRTQEGRIDVSFISILNPKTLILKFLLSGFTFRSLNYGYQYESFWNQTTKIETLTHELRLKPNQNPIEITHLFLRLNEIQVLYVSLKKEFSERQIDRLRSGFIYRDTHPLERMQSVSKGKSSVEIWSG